MERDEPARDVLVAGGHAHLRRIAVDHEGPEDGELVGIARLAVHAGDDGRHRRHHGAGLGNGATGEPA